MPAHVFAEVGEVADELARAAVHQRGGVQRAGLVGDVGCIVRAGLALPGGRGGKHDRVTTDTAGRLQVRPTLARPRVRAPPATPPGRCRQTQSAPSPKMVFDPARTR